MQPLNPRLTRDEEPSQPQHSRGGAFESFGAGEVERDSSAKVDVGEATSCPPDCLKNHAGGVEIDFGDVELVEAKHAVVLQGELEPLEGRTAVSEERRARRRKPRRLASFSASCFGSALR